MGFELEIQENAFFRSLLTELDLSSCVALERLGRAAFFYSPIIRLDLRLAGRTRPLAEVWANCFGQSPISQLRLFGAYLQLGLYAF